MTASRREQALLAHLGRQLAGETRLEHFLEIMSEEVEALLGARHCRIFLDPKGERFLGPTSDGYTGLKGELAGRIHRAVESGISVRLDRGTGKVENLMAAPMLGHDGKVLGYIEVANKKNGQFTPDDEGFLMLLASITGYAMDNERLNRDLQDSHLETIYRLATVAEFRDPEDLSGHLRRMSRYSAILAEGMGMPKLICRQILYASPLHDIGKVGIPDAVLLKRGKLTPEEYEVMKKHTLLGAEMLANARSELLKMASRIALFHHEKFDGSGYPNGVRGERIPIEVRVVSVADVFDALASRRVYKEAWKLSDVAKYFRERRGKDFDPKVVDTLDKMLPRIKAVMAEEKAKGDKPPKRRRPSAHHLH